MTKVLLLDKVAKEGEDILKNAGFEVDVENNLSTEEKLKVIGNYEAIVIRSATKFTHDFFDAATALKLIVRGGEGTDNIDKPYAAEKGIIVENTPGQNSHAVAELTLAHIFGLARHIPEADTTMQKGEWAKKKLKGTELKGKTIGLIGAGKIGGDIANICKALGMNVIVYDPFLKQEDVDYKLVEVNDVLEESDYVSIHVPLNDKTRGMIGKNELAKMKKTACIINCARGGIIDEDALVEAVKNGVIKGAAIDVYTKEPPENSPLIGVPGIHLTPHLGASTSEAQVNCAVTAANQIVAYFKEGKVLNKVN